MQSLNHHIVVGILREAKTDLCQFRPLFVYLQRRFLAHAQIDFRVNQFEVAACKQTKFGQFVEALAPVLQFPAEHHALPVVALLNADIEVAVLVERQEEILQEVERGFLGVNARVHVPLEVRVDVPVKPPDRVVVVPLQPQRVMEDAEHLERLAKVGRAVARDAGQHLHHIAAILLNSQALVAVAEVDDGINHAPAVCVRILPHGKQTRTDDPTVIKREVGDKAQLMDVVFCSDVRPLRLGEDVGLFFDRPHQHDLFKRR